MISVRIGKRGQVTLPREIRKKIGLREGDHIAFILQEGQVVIRPMTQTLLDMRGSVPVAEPQDFEAVRKQVIHARARRVARDER